MIKELLLLYTSSWTTFFMISVGIYLVGQAFAKIIRSLHLWEDSRVYHNTFNNTKEDK